MVFQQGGAPDYVVSVEAENYSARSPAPSGHAWVADASFPGYSGTGTMRAMPDSGASNNAGYSASSPRLDFRVNFVTAGVHRVYVRGYAPVGDNDDTVHVGLDGAEVSTSDRIGWSSVGVYEWRRATLDNVNATINIPSAGLHTINVWMREDGFVFDKLVLTIDPPTAGPSGAGPAESSQVPDPTPNPGSLQFSAPTYAAGEGAGTATVTVTRTGGTAGSVSASYGTSDGIATAGSDYAAASGTVTFADGDSAPKSFSVTLTDDAAAEGNETINLSLGSPSGGATLGSPSTAVLTVTDNDSGSPPGGGGTPPAPVAASDDEGDEGLCGGSVAVGAPPAWLVIALGLLLAGVTISRR
jgi:hypothetical protein